MNTINEIGGEFDLDYISLMKKANSPSLFYLNELFSLSERKYKLVNTGRSAIKAVISLIQDNNKKHILLPSYLCASMVKPFLEMNVVVEFYKINKDFSINLDDLESRINENTRAIFVNNYFNISINEKTKKKILDLKSNNDLILIEDITHTLLNRRRKDFGDVLIGSIRKWFALPSGGIIISNNKNIDLEEFSLMSDMQSTFHQYRILGQVLKNTYVHEIEQPKLKEKFMQLFKDAENDLDDNEIKVTKIDNYSQNILQRIDIKEIRDARIRNFKILYEGLKGLNDSIKMVGEQLSNVDDIVPLGFPVLSSNREGLKLHLIKNKIYPPIHWELPSYINKEIYTKSYDLSENILTIPCDHRYTAEDMYRVIEVIKNFYN
ncbi:DegT/DnrJ/EryC1/StrS family aminotransferase [Gracilibacillus sp. JCM 18860]|uniref:DegT/DnrJ/EryC1/StrS family aminotransferase n=1 Tax=Gracilibacillus sp. JCM 18860 TaxID=1306159 RepID=UPI0032605E80